MLVYIILMSNLATAAPKGFADLASIDWASNKSFNEKVSRAVARRSSGRFCILGPCDRGLSAYYCAHSPGLSPFRSRSTLNARVTFSAWSRYVFSLHVSLLFDSFREQVSMRILSIPLKCRQSVFRRATTAR